METNFSIKSPIFLYFQVFVFKAQLRGGQIAIDQTQVEDHLWLTKDELRQYLPKKYWSVANRFILDL